MADQSVHYSSARTGAPSQDDWQTPSHIVALAQRVLDGVSMDPCAAIGGRIGLRNVYPAEDGLTVSWTGETVYMNPPYSKARDWVSKWVGEDVRGALALLPARPGSQWWTELTESGALLCLIRGRLTFEGAPNCAPFPSCLWYRGPNAPQFVREASAIGDVWIPFPHPNGAAA